MPTDKEYLSLEDVADKLGVTYQLIYKLVRSGALPAVRLGKLYRVSAADLDEYLQRNKAASSRGGDCSFCGEHYASDLSLKHVCTEDGCEAVICNDCWTRRKVRFCKDHQPK